MRAPLIALLLTSVTLAFHGVGTKPAPGTVLHGTIGPFTADCMVINEECVWFFPASLVGDFGTLTVQEGSKIISTWNWGMYRRELKVTPAAVPCPPYFDQALGRMVCTAAKPCTRKKNAVNGNWYCME